MKYSYLVCPAEGGCYEIESQTELSLKEQQKIVGGYIEVVTQGEHYVICNEDGKLQDLPINKFFPDFRGTVIITKDI